MSSFDILNDDCLKEILDQLSICELASSALVSHHWNEQFRPLALRRRTLALKFSDAIACDYSEVQHKMNINTVQLKQFSKEYAHQLGSTFANVETLEMDFNEFKTFKMFKKPLQNSPNLLLTELRDSLKAVNINFGRSVYREFAYQTEIFKTLNEMHQLEVLEIGAEWDAQNITALSQLLAMPLILRLREFRFKSTDNDDFLAVGIIAYLADVTSNATDCALKSIDIRFPVREIGPLRNIMNLPASMSSKLTYLDIRDNWRLYENKFLNDDWHRLTTAFTNLQTLVLTSYSFISIATLTSALSPLKQLKLLKLSAKQTNTNTLQNTLPNKRTSQEDAIYEPQVISPLISVTELHLDFSLSPLKHSHQNLQHLLWSVAFPNLTAVSLTVKVDGCDCCQHYDLFETRDRVDLKYTKLTWQRFTQQMYAEVKDNWVMEVLSSLHRCARRLILPFKPCKQLSAVMVKHKFSISEDIYFNYRKMYTFTDECLKECAEQIDAKNEAVSNDGVNYPSCSSTNNLNSD